MFVYKSKRRGKRWKKYRCIVRIADRELQGTQREKFSVKLARSAKRLFSAWQTRGRSGRLKSKWQNRVEKRKRNKVPNQTPVAPKVRRVNPRVHRTEKFVKRRKASEQGEMPWRTESSARGKSVCQGIFLSEKKLKKFFNSVQKLHGICERI